MSLPRYLMARTDLVAMEGKISISTASRIAPRLVMSYLPSISSRRKTHAFGQDDAETIEQGGLSGIGLGDTTQADVAMGRSGQHDIVRLNALQLFKDGAR